MIQSIKHFCLLLTALAFLAACRGPARQELETVSFVVMNGTVIDGTGADPIVEGLVAIEGNRIVAVGPAADFTIPAEVPVIDAAGGTILPGVMNAHGHRVATAAARRHLFLLDGVTAVCDLNSILSQLDAFEQEAAQTGPAARGFPAGPMVAPPGGYPGDPGIYAIQGAAEAEMAVRDLHSRGAAFIKVALEPGLLPIFAEEMPVLDLPELRAIVATAHELDLLVRAHVTDPTMLDLALDAGVDSIEHVPFLSYLFEDAEAMFGEAGAFQMPREMEARLLRMIDQGVVLVPTLDVTLDETPYRSDIEPVSESFIEATLGIVQFFHESGGVIAAGNDYGAGPEPGMPLREMDLLQSAGLSPMEIIEAATRHAAYICGQSDELGTLEEGKLADLIVVAGNPLDDLQALDAVLYVVKDGEVVVSPEPESQ